MQKSFSIPIQSIELECLKGFDVSLRMARADKVHNLASGNKIYKLGPIIEYAKANKYKQILSFGGAYSNHIHALALMAKQHDIESIAVIRGEEKYAENPTLSDATKAGMKLIFANRQEYKQRNDVVYLEQLQNRFPEALIVAEGGSGELGVKGCAQMTLDINANHLEHVEYSGFPDNQTTEILTVASGTGATAAGLICGLAENQKLIAYSVLKDESLKARIDAFVLNDASASKNNQQKLQQYSLQNADYGGYAKLDKSLLDFIIDCLEQTGVLLDPIYTSKMCRKVVEQIKLGQFEKGQSITLIHTGGLQGWRGMQQRVETLSGESTWQKISQYLKD